MHTQLIRITPVWFVYLILAIPGVLYTYWLLTNNLGADPIRIYERQIGLWAMQLIILGLLVTPVRNLLGVNLIKFRRAIGLMAFYYVLAHLTSYLVLDQTLDFNAIWTDIVKRPYITFGMIAVLVLLPLAFTSNNWSIRKLGPQRWRRIHQGVYLVALLTILHYVLLAKRVGTEEIIYTIILLVLLGYRVVLGVKKRIA